MLKAKSLLYLLKLRRKKGTDILYKSIQMSDYLMPNKFIIDINDKQLLFSIKNDMYLLEENCFVKKSCLCNKSTENLSHLYICELYNDKEHQFPFNKIYNGNLQEQHEILNIMKLIFQKRNKYTSEI